MGVLEGRSHLAKNQILLVKKKEEGGTKTNYMVIIWSNVQAILSGAALLRQEAMTSLHSSDTNHVIHFGLLFILTITRPEGMKTGIVN